jgi:hypothetical protein
MFNPRAEVGAAYRMIRDGHANVVHLSALSHPNVVTGQNQIPGAVNRGTTVRRINEWCRPLAEDELADSECFELPTFLEGTTAKSQSGHEYPPLKPGYYKIIEPAFSYMVLGQYPSQGSDQLISREWVNKARSRWDAYVAQNGEIPPKFVNGIMGLDVAEFGSDLNCVCIRYGGYVEKVSTWGNVDPIVSGEKAAWIFKSNNILTVNVDATGVGAGVAPHMNRLGCRGAYSIKVASSPTTKAEIGDFRILRDQMWWQTREWLRIDPGAMLPPDEELIEELLVPTYELKNGKIEVMKKAVMRELLGRSPNKADALCLTFVEPGRIFDPLDMTKMPRKAA